MRQRQGIIIAALLASIGATTAAAAQEDSLAVRKALEAQYLKLAAAHEREDLSAILALKAADFHAIFPDGRVGDHLTMEEYSKQFLASNEPPYNTKFTIQTLAVSDHGLIAVVEVLQELSRYKELAGKRRKVDTSVVQRETWSKTADGWKLKCVDSVRDGKRFVDGKRVDPTKPYDPESPAFEPEEQSEAR